MPGGDEAAYRDVEAIFTTIAAQVDGTPCCTYVGPGGAGHYVKMVHNGIEYADMQLIAEAYDLLRYGVGLDGAEIADVFADWNEGAAGVVPDRDHGRPCSAKTRRARPARPLVDVIVDEAEQKGTGPLDGAGRARARRPADRHHRGGVRAHAVGPARRARGGRGRARRPAAARATPTARLVDDVATALYASKIVAYAQGFVQIAAASDEHDWGVDLGAMATLWRGGCIIRARFLDRIREAYDDDPHTANLLLVDPFTERGRRRAGRVAARSSTPAVELGIPAPAFASVARLLRRLPARARPGEPDPGPARPVRRPHLPAPGRRGLVPHPLGAGRLRGAHATRDRRDPVRRPRHAAAGARRRASRSRWWRSAAGRSCGTSSASTPRRGCATSCCSRGYRREQVEAFVRAAEWPDGRRRALRRHRAGHADRRAPVARARGARRGRRSWPPTPTASPTSTSAPCATTTRRTAALATVTVVRPRAAVRRRAARRRRRASPASQEKPRAEHWINGGFFAFEPGALDYLREDSVLEREPLERLAADGELHAFRHKGFWACMDTYKDAVALNDLWAAGDRALAPGDRRRRLESARHGRSFQVGGDQAQEGDRRRAPRQALHEARPRDHGGRARRAGATSRATRRSALAVQKAKDASMPKDNIERAIAKGTGEGGDADALEAVMYEGYGPGGVAVLVEATTDNRNRTGSEVRHMLRQARRQPRRARARSPTCSTSRASWWSTPSATPRTT